MILKKEKDLGHERHFFREKRGLLHKRLRGSIGLKRASPKEGGRGPQVLLIVSMGGELIGFR